MAVDLSQLSPEKQAFLKSNPELLKSLEEAIPQQITEMNKRREKVDKGKAKWQRDLEDVDRRVEDAKQKAEDLRRKYDPELMKIEKHFIEQTVKAKGALVCPECGDSGHGNKMNGTPWCMKCNGPLISKGKVETWKKTPKIKVLPKSLKDELRRLNLGLYPKG